VTTHADIAADLGPEPQPLAYATATSDGPALADLQPALSWLLAVAVLIGLCVGSCFLLMTTHWAAAVLHVAIYGAILFTAVRGSVELAKVGFSRPGLFTLDGLAGVGLVLIGCAPLGLLLRYDTFNLGVLGSMGLAVAFGLLAVTSIRHREFYQKLSYPVRAAGYRKTAIWLQILGWTKAIFETLWLVCCALPPLAVTGSVFRMRPSFEGIAITAAVGAFFGCFLYAGIWITMIVLHARVLRLSRIRGVAGFDVLINEPSLR
jgi:hypothetical protein